MFIDLNIDLYKVMSDVQILKSLLFCFSSKKITDEQISKTVFDFWFYCIFLRFVDNYVHIYTKSFNILSFSLFLKTTNER